MALPAVASECSRPYQMFELQFQQSAGTKESAWRLSLEAEAPQIRRQACAKLLLQSDETEDDE